MLAKNTMIPNTTWIEDWHVGENPKRERAVSTELIAIFTEFWNALGLDAKSKTTRNRYCSSLHAVGGYLVKQAISDKCADKTTRELLSEHIGPYDGPLIHHDEDAWQHEVDMVCRKLYKYLNSRCWRLLN